MTTTSYDMIIVGTGAGGSTLAHSLAPTGKRILILERGERLVRSKDNWDPKKVFGEELYHAPERWLDKDDKPFRPQIAYLVGGQTKVFGAALLRLREIDFQARENCRTHEVENLYLVDGSFFPSASAVNPALTIAANALRVGEKMKSGFN